MGGRPAKCYVEVVENDNSELSGDEKNKNTFDETRSWTCLVGNDNDLDSGGSIVGLRDRRCYCHDRVDGLKAIF